MIESIWVMWVPWTRIAVAQAADAGEAAGPTSDELEREAQSGIVAICSAVFAVEALFKAAEQLVVPPPISYRWNGKPCGTCGHTTDHETGMVKKLREILKRSITDQASLLTSRHGGRRSCSSGAAPCTGRAARSTLPSTPPAS